MIIIPKCFKCKNYKDGKCPAYPEGIPREVLGNNDKSKNCGETVYHFEDKAS